MRIIIAEKGKPINLGRVGEDITKVVKFDLSEIAFPNATYTIAHRPQGATASYFGDSYVENGMLCWLIHDSDLVKTGIGRCEVIATGNGVAKSYIYQTRVDESIDGEIGEVPPPYQPWVDSVLSEFAFSHKLENITCNYISIPHDSEPHCDSEETETGLILTFYIPMGADGKDGKDGADGFTPSASVSKVGDTSTITITDKQGTTSVEVKDGKDATQTIEVTHEDEEVKLYTKEEVDAILSEYEKKEEEWELLFEGDINQNTNVNIDRPFKRISMVFYCEQCSSNGSSGGLTLVSEYGNAYHNLPAVFTVGRSSAISFENKNGYSFQNVGQYVGRDYRTLSWWETTILYYTSLTLSFPHFKWQEFDSVRFSHNNNGVTFSGHLAIWIA